MTQSKGTDRRSRLQGELRGQLQAPAKLGGVPNRFTHLSPPDRLASGRDRFSVCGYNLHAP